MKNFKDLKSRFLVSIISIIILILVIFFADLLFMRFIVTLVICSLGAFGANEFVHFAKKKQIAIDKNLLVGAVIFEIIAFFIYSQYAELQILPILVFFLFLIFLFFSNFNKIENSLLRISTAAFGFLYIAIPLGMVLPILYIETIEMQDGRFWIFYLIFVTKITDIGAYFGGRLFGKKKLAAKVSPKKTVFGSVTGLIFALGGSLLFLIFAKSSVFDFNLSEAIVLGIILGVFAQFGDLTESLIKRDSKIKDSSKIPGFGGVLDMLDSHIFNIPILFMFLVG
ncbi:MAG: Phosphatidate cytidylyltransferase [Candidatus Anoxychlamydiales bacterium]|uniref:Phosphatidate cytidylyltransferase n=1 Tax=marine sediment metagenome TaxID=412755 RepID=A0A0F9KKZ0_9ZZZZ|nr:Phosphatidate cytidylyltransferase [Candidatus Anoxychlamydiales bacterium]NGX40351.1 Phosphatidate cytidylyltransferase [Candidatus Anoxychlamydiales bacterium]HEU64467.1 CDP-archaeol synthase [Chlamydiota bacterium]